MASRLECRKIENQALAHLKGETSIVAEQRFRAHLNHCASCQESVREVSELMETTRAQRFVPTPDERERILHSVLTRLDSKKGRPETSPLKLRRFVGVIIAAAASIVLGLAIWGSGVKKTESIRPELEARKANKVVERAEPVAPVLETQRIAPHITIGVDPGTQFAFDQDETIFRLGIEQGRMWIKVDRSQSSPDLEVRGRGVTVRVTGTVLMVHAQPGAVMEVGVLKGEVVIIEETGDSITMSQDEFRKSDGTVIDFEHSGKKRGTAWLEGLGELREPPPSPEQDIEEPVTFKRSLKRKTGSRSRLDKREITDLYVLAEAEMATGNFKRAAVYLEQLIVVSPKSTRADTARLELGRLYAKQLKSPRRARKHLKAYLRRHPQGAKTELVKQMLQELEIVQK